MIKNIQVKQQHLTREYSDSCCLYVGKSWNWPASAVTGTSSLISGCCWLPVATGSPSLAEDTFLFFPALEPQDAADEASSVPP